MKNEDYEEMEEMPVVVGKSEAVNGVVDDDTIYAAVLWIPDPTERRGWRDLWLERKSESKQKQAGYRKHP